MADLLNTNPNDSYGDDAIVTLSPREHIRLRPGMYIGKLGDGTQADDGIYVLIKEVVDNSVDEFIMGAGRQIDISIEDKVVSVRDYGRGIPLKSLAAAVSEMNTGGKYGGSAFKKTVGLNGVGVKAVNMLSGEFTARSVRDGEARTVTFAKGLEVSDKWESGVREKNGTFISFRVDEEVFGEYAYNLEYVEQKIRNYSYLNLGLTLNFNGKSYVSKNGLLDLVNDNMTEDPLYPPIHLTGEDIEVVITHGTDTLEETAYFLNLTVHSDKPVVLVGAMRPATAISADGPLNLLNAVKLAADPQAKGRGVLIAMNDTIGGARDTTKTNTTNVATFKAPELGAMGYIAAGKNYFFNQSTRRHTSASEFDVTKLDALPRVDIVYSHANADRVPVDAFVKAGAKGLVMAGSGNGSLHEWEEKGAAEAIKNGVVVVRSSRVGNGPVTVSVKRYTDEGFLNGGTLNPQKARILLQLALTRTHDPKEIQRIFDEY